MGKYVSLQQDCILKSTECQNKYREKKLNVQNVSTASFFFLKFFYSIFDKEV